jgi:hypothetical protein
VRAGQLSKTGFPGFPRVRTGESEDPAGNRHRIGSGNPNHTQTAKARGRGDGNDGVVRVQGTAKRDQERPRLCARGRPALRPWGRPECW